MIKNSVKRIYNFFYKYPWILYILVYLTVNILFNYKIYWQELFYDRSKVGAVFGEVQATEWAIEIIYNKLIHLQNPFTPFSDILYPFGLDITGADAGVAFNMIFFRPFLSTHQAFSMIIVTSLFLGNIGMYLLLRTLKIRKIIAFIIGLAYGYMTFLTERLGHPTYSFTYLLPLYYYGVILFLNSKKIYTKVLSTILTLVMFVLTFWQNMYYFIILLLSSGFLFVYYFIQKRKLVISLLKIYKGYIFLAIVLVLLLLLPWLSVLRQSALFSQLPKSSGWAGAIDFSSDLFGFFIPSDNNYYYGKFAAKVIQRIPFAQGIFENFTYPGIIILSLYAYLFFRYRSLTKGIKQQIVPFLLTSIIFAILTLGPFLHVLGRWALVVDDGIPIVFPLPFVILHYIPLLGNIRAPGRLIVGFIFFAYIVCAYLLNHLLKNKSNKFVAIVVVCLFFVFIIDQRYPDEIDVQPMFYPNNLYSKIQQDPGDVTVMEIPFTVRDGFTYFGDYHSIDVFIGNNIHKKSFIGGYSGRIPDYVKNYYSCNAFVGYIGRKIDLDIENNPSIDHDDIKNWRTIDVAGARLAADFLDIKYVILDMNYPYSKRVANDLTSVGYRKIMQENLFTLWLRKPTDKEFLSLKMSDPQSSLMLGQGWYNLEGDFRWNEGKSSVLFKISKPKKIKLNFTAASFHKPDKMDIYLNKVKIGSVAIATELKDYTVTINNIQKEGINILYFISSNDYKPSKVVPGSADERSLGAKFTSINLTETK